MGQRQARQGAHSAAFPPHIKPQCCRKTCSHSHFAAGKASGAGSKPKGTHQTLKNRILLENYFLPGDLEAQIEAFVEHYNHQRYHESLNNVTPADAYFGRAPAIIKQRERIKRQTIEYRRLQHRKLAA